MEVCQFPYTGISYFYWRKVSLRQHPSSVSIPLYGYLLFLPVNVSYETENGEVCQFPYTGISYFYTQEMMNVATTVNVVSIPLNGYLLFLRYALTYR